MENSGSKFFSVLQNSKPLPVICFFFSFFFFSHLVTLIGIVMRLITSSLLFYEGYLRTSVHIFAGVYVYFDVRDIASPQKLLSTEVFSCSYVVENVLLQLKEKKGKWKTNTFFMLIIIIISFFSFQILSHYYFSLFFFLFACF